MVTVIGYTSSVQLFCYFFNLFFSLQKTLPCSLYMVWLVLWELLYMAINQHNMHSSSCIVSCRFENFKVVNVYISWELPWVSQGLPLVNGWHLCSITTRCQSTLSRTMLFQVWCYILWTLRCGQMFRFLNYCGHLTLST